MFNKTKSIVLIQIMYLTLVPFFVYSQPLKDGDGIKVTLFGKGVISTQDFEFNASFTPGEDTVYYTKSSSNFALMSIVFAIKKRNDTWEKPQLAPFSGKYRDADPFVSPTGDKIFFLSNRPVNPEEKLKGFGGLWYVDKKGKGWSTAKPLTFSEYDEYNFLAVVYPSVATNGNLYFAAVDSVEQRPHFYFSAFKNGKYLKPQKLGFSQAGDIDPLISADESFLVFVSRSREGIGGKDLFISFRENGGWSEPRALPYPVNTAFSEGQPGISSDNKFLFFTSERTTRYPPDFTASFREEALKNYDEVVNELRSVDNGRANIYYVKIEDLLKAM